MKLYQKGYLTMVELKQLYNYPSHERFKKGPIAIIECVQEIPCNPCETSCKYGAIKIGESITALPILEEELCTGCGRCIALCPGLAIFIIDKSYSKSMAKVTMPYEYLPLPEKNQIVEAVNRAGKAICLGRVIRIFNTKATDKTPVLTVEIPFEFADEVRSIKRL